MNIFESRSYATQLYHELMNENAYGSLNEYIAKLADLWTEDYGEDVEETLDELMQDSDIRDMVNDAYDNGDAPSEVIEAIFDSYYDTDEEADDYDEDDIKYIDPEENLDAADEEDPDIQYIDPEENLNTEYEDEPDVHYVDPEENLYNDEYDESIELTPEEAEYLYEDTLTPDERMYLFERHEWDGMEPYYRIHLKALYSRIADAISRHKFDRTRGLDALTRQYLGDIGWIINHVPNASGKDWLRTRANIINAKRAAADLPELAIEGDNAIRHEPALPPRLRSAIENETINIPAGTRGAQYAETLRGNDNAQATEEPTEEEPVEEAPAQEEEPAHEEAPTEEPAHEAPTEEPAHEAPANDNTDDDYETQVVTRTRPVTRTRTVTRTRPVVRTRTVTVHNPVTRTRTVPEGDQERELVGSKFHCTLEYDPNDTQTYNDGQQVISDIQETLVDDGTVNGRITHVSHNADEGIDVWDIYVVSNMAGDIRAALRTSWEDAFAMASFEESTNEHFTVSIHTPEHTEEYQEDEESQEEEEYEDQEEYQEEEEYQDQEEYQEEIRVPRHRNNNTQPATPARTETPAAAPAARAETPAERAHGDAPRTDMVRRVPRTNRWRVIYKVADENDEETDETDSVVVTAANADEAKQKIEHPASPTETLVYDCHHVVNVEPEP